MLRLTMTQVVYTYLFTAVMIRFEKERYTVNEGAGSVTLVLLINIPKAINVGVVYSTTDETARGTYM